MALFMDPPIGGGTWYLSQALAVVNNTTGGQPVDRPLVDTTDDQVMTITVRNGKKPVDNVFVQYWVCAFSAGFAGPLYLPISANGMKGKQIDPFEPSTHSVPGGLNHVFTDSFKPTSAEVAPLVDPTNPNADFHACILANVYSLKPTPDGARIPATTTVPPTAFPAWNPVGNPHHAQRNITLVTPDTDGVKKIDFMMHAGNPDPEIDVKFELEIRELHLGRGQPQIGKVELDHLLRHPRIVKRESERRPTPTRDPLATIAIQLGNKLVPIKLATKPLRSLQIDAGDRAAPRTRIALGPDAAAQIRLQADLPEEENVLRIFDVVQSRDGKAVGGARVLFLNAPTAIRRPVKRAS